MTILKADMFRYLNLQTFCACAYMNCDGAASPLSRI